MKRISLGLWSGAILTTLLAFHSFTPGSIRGTVTPITDNAVVKVISGTDTVHWMASGGVFELPTLKAGTYELLVEVPPYKTAVKEGVIVSDNGATDVGQIKLER